MTQLRGCKLLLRSQKGIKTISLYAKNSRSYYLLISYRWANIYLKKKSFEFSNLEDAELVYRKLLPKKILHNTLNESQDRVAFEAQ